MAPSGSNGTFSTSGVFGVDRRDVVIFGRCSEAGIAEREHIGVVRRHHQSPADPDIAVRPHPVDLCKLVEADGEGRARHDVGLLPADGV